MISSGVFANAVINVIGNTSGLRSAMRETQTQLWGMMTLANRMGGAITRNLLAPYTAWIGMQNVASAQNTGAAMYSHLMQNWRAGRPVRPPKQYASPPPFVLSPQAFQHWQAQHQAYANYPNAVAQWMAQRPNRQQVMSRYVQGAAIAEGKFLLLGAAIEGVAGLLIKATANASQFTEELNRMTATFGRSSDFLMGHVNYKAQWGVGQSEYMAGLSTIGVELMGAGIPEKTATMMAVQMGKRAMDVMSQYNLPDVDTAIRKFSSGLAGNGRPMKELGILLDETRVETYALAQGLWDGHHALTENIKVQARYGLIMQETARAAGDFEKTWGEQANQMRAFKGNVENLATRFGKLLEPLIGIILAPTNRFLGNLNDILQNNMDLGGWVAGKLGWTGPEEERKRQTSRQNRMAMDRQYADEIIANAKLAERHRGASHSTLEGFAKRLREGVFNDHGKMLVDLTRVLVGLTKEQIAELKKLYPKLKTFTEQNAPANAWGAN